MSYVKFTRSGAPDLIISDGPFAIPKRADFETRAAELSKLNVGTILTVSDDAIPTPDHIRLYDSVGATSVQVLLNEASETLDKLFLPNVLAAYIAHMANERRRNKAFLVHCLAGVNRSGLALAALLWTTTAEPRPWSNVDEMLVYIRGKTKPRKFMEKAAYVESLKQWAGEATTKRKRELTTFNEGEAMWKRRIA